MSIRIRRFHPVRCAYGRNLRNTRPRRCTIQRGPAERQHQIQLGAERSADIRRLDEERRRQLSAPLRLPESESRRGSASAGRRRKQRSSREERIAASPRTSTRASTASCFQSRFPATGARRSSSGRSSSTGSPSARWRGSGPTGRSPLQGPAPGAEGAARSRRINPRSWLWLAHRALPSRIRGRSQRPSATTDCPRSEPAADAAAAAPTVRRRSTTRSSRPPPRSTFRRSSVRRRPGVTERLQVSLFVWRGPAAVTFTPPAAGADQGKAVFSAAFTRPGEYVLRARVTDTAAYTVQDIKVVVGAP